MTQHLWEINHPYYCSESNYFATGHQNRETQHKYESFEDFLNEWGDADDDYNLVFRWDWEEITQEDYNYQVEDGEESSIIPYAGDNTIKTGKLKVFFFLQRKGYFVYTETDVSRSDELEVKAYLSDKWSHMNVLWEGIS